MIARAAASLVIVLAAAPIAWGQLSYKVDYSTYLGGKHWEHARDTVTDASGFTYVVGGTASPDFTGAASFPEANPYNTGLTQTYTNGTNGGMTYNPADANFGPADVFVTKLNQAGQVQWTKYIGGQHYDRAYAVELDTAGNVIITGRAGKGYATTAGLQTDWAGTTNTSNYGGQNGFVTKLNSSGQILWSTYVGRGELARDVAVDSSGDIYIPLVLSAGSSRDFTSASAPGSLKTYFNGKFKNSAPTTNTDDVGVAKIDGATGQLEWARWLGGTGSEATNPSIRVNSAGEAYLLLNTTSTNTSLATVGSGVQTNNGGGTDAYLAKFNASGTGLIYGTYLGGAGTEAHETHGLALDQNGNAVVMNHTSSADYPVTAGALNMRGGASDIGITRFDANGVRTVSAVVGGNGGEGPDGIYVDAAGRIYISGETNSSAGWTPTAGAIQSINKGGQDAFFMVLSPDLKTIDYLTYFGGTDNDNGRSMYLGQDGTVWMLGGTLSNQTTEAFPIFNPSDGTYGGGAHAQAPSSGDAWVARFSVVPEPTSLAFVLAAGTLLKRPSVKRRNSRGTRKAGITQQGEPSHINE